MEGMEIMGLKDIMRDYNLSRYTALAYLNMRSCPVLPRTKNSTYRVVRSNWEKWLAGLSGGKRH